MPEAGFATVMDVRERLLAGDPLLLVCIYDYDEMHLDGAISMGEFERRVPTLTPAREVVFY